MILRINVVFKFIGIRTVIGEHIIVTGKNQFCSNLSRKISSLLEGHISDAIIAVTLSISSVNG